MKTLSPTTAKILDTIEAELWRRMGEYATAPSAMSNEGIHNLLGAIINLQQVRAIENPAA